MIPFDYMRFSDGLKPLTSHAVCRGLKKEGLKKEEPSANELFVGITMGLLVAFLSGGLWENTKSLETQLRN